MLTTGSLNKSAAEKHPLSLSVAVGDEVTLLCENLFENGKIHNDSRAKSDRLSLTANCSLVIKKVTVEDTGRYSCRQFNKSGYQQGRDSEVYLSVIMTEHKETDLVTLGCSVSTFGRCRHTVRWLFNGQDWDRHNRNVKTDQPSCYASLNFLTFCYNNASNYNLLKCEVKDPGPSGENMLNSLKSLQTDVNNYPK
uniref:Immunoglobulin domain-containing protein n=1 Tax=Dicentrarchus labrax TaxID=13489 RepID=A0A8C4DMW8_DICLA